MYTCVLLLSALFQFAGMCELFCELPSSQCAPKHNIDKFLLPKHHRLQPILKKIFYSNKVVKNRATLTEAGFKILYTNRYNHMRMVSHPKAPGYFFKLNLTDESKDLKKYQQKLVQRCVSAEIIRKLIDRYKIRYFKVADKWLYVIAPSNNNRSQVLVLVAKDMKIASSSKNRHAWQTKITRAHLRELYLVLRSGYGSSEVLRNVPYMRGKLFAFIDTEYSRRRFKLRNLIHVLSREMQIEWEKIVMDGARR